MPKLLWLLEYPTISGGERSLAAAIPWVRDAGWELSALVPVPSPAANLLTASGVRIVPSLFGIPADRRHASLDERRARLAEVLVRQSPDLVIANSLSMARLAGPVTAALGLRAGGHLRDIVRLSAAAVADVNRLDRLWAVSQAARDEHLAQGVSSDKLRVAYNGIDLEAFQPRPASGSLIRELCLPAGAQLIGVIGQLVQRKGVDLALEAFVSVAVDRPDWHLVVIGERYSQKDEALQFESQLHTRRVQSGIAERIHFLGWRDDVHKLLAELTLLVHAARQEPLGRVLLEAAACGLPVMATDVGGTREVFADHGTANPELACELVPAGNVQALATGMRRLIDDASRRAALGIAARRQMERNFDIRQRGPALAAEYRELLTSPRTVENRDGICYNNNR
ncbi:MAG: glycosyltransferase family 4 protein [Pirellulales bacterium]